MPSYIYWLQNASVDAVMAAAFRLSVTDPDETPLSRAQLESLQIGGKTMLSYLSIGEAEDYRAYWQGWDDAPPDFLLDENPDWPGNYKVAFWDPTWQGIIESRLLEIVAAGYNGVYLDIIDGYEDPQVAAAYDGPGTVRQAMEDFVARLSNAAKAVNPAFQIVPQNAVGLLEDPDAPGQPNLPYLSVIDGIGKEDTFTLDNDPVAWTDGDLALMAIGQAAGKYIIAIDYPTDPAIQAAFVAQALARGFIGFIGDRDLTGIVAPANTALADGLDPALFAHLPALGGLGTAAADDFAGGIGPDALFGRAGNDTLAGNGAADTLAGGPGHDIIYGNALADLIRGGKDDDWLFGGQGADTLQGEDGADTLAGGKGVDWLTGGGGGDTFILSGENGTDHITDYNPAEDGLSYTGPLTFTTTAAGTLVSAGGIDLAWLDGWFG